MKRTPLSRAGDVLVALLAVASVAGTALLVVFGLLLATISGGSAEATIRTSTAILVPALAIAIGVAFYVRKRRAMRWLALTAALPPLLALPFAIYGFAHPPAVFTSASTITRADLHEGRGMRRRRLTPAQIALFERMLMHERARSWMPPAANATALMDWFVEYADQPTGFAGTFGFGTYDGRRAMFRYETPSTELVATPIAAADIRRWCAAFEVRPCSPAP